MTAQKSILLVHGASHGAWCWDRVVPLLSAHGHRVQTIDLPGRAGKRKAGWRVKLADHAQAVLDHARHEESPIIAVGHSLAGQVISAAAEREPGLFERLVFLAAFLPRSGDSVAKLGQEDKNSELSTVAKANLLHGTVMLRPETTARVFYDDCSPADVVWARSRLVAESLRPSLESVTLTAERFGSVPRSYIRCTEDRAISIQMQDRMLARQPCDPVLSLNASHSPFVSMPERLATAIMAASLLN